MSRITDSMVDEVLGSPQSAPPARRVEPKPPEKEVEESSEYVANALSIVESQTRGEVDTQITTARRFPRSIKQFMSDCRDLVTLDEEVAASCIYALPRDGKTIFGPTARFAEAVAACWGHLRAGSFIVGEEDKYVVVRGFAWDVQKNIAIAFDVRRRIVNKAGKRFNDDMIGVTAAAAGSIAYRNAVLKVVPAAIWKPLWNEARTVVAGDIKTISERRDMAVESFIKLGVQKERIFAALGVRGIEDVGIDHLVTLRGFYTSIKDEGNDIDTVFPPIAQEQDRSSLADRLKQRVAPREDAGPEPTKVDTKRVAEELEKRRAEAKAAGASTKPQDGPPFETSQEPSEPEPQAEAKPTPAEKPKQKIRPPHLFSKKSEPQSSGEHNIPV